MTIEETNRQIISSRMIDRPISDNGCTMRVDDEQLKRIRSHRASEATRNFAWRLQMINTQRNCKTVQA